MPIKIRLQRHGAKRRPFYFIVVADDTAPRDGKFIEKLGSYNPLTVPATILLKSDRALYWLEQGAKPTETVRKILSFKGVLYLKHLLRGVKLGIFDEDTALKKFEEWKADHEKDVMDRSSKHKDNKKAERDEVLKASAVAKKVKVDEATVSEEETENAESDENIQESPEANADEAADSVKEDVAVESEDSNENAAE